MKSKILICSHFFYPSVTPRAFRATELADEFVRKGYQVDLLIGENSTLLVNYSNKKKEKLEKDKILKSTKKVSELKELASKVICYFVGEVNMIKKKKLMNKINRIDEYDVIISIGLPFYMHYLVGKKIRNSSWNGVSISDWGDPFYKVDEGKIMAPYMKYIQKKTMKSYTYITIPVNEAIPYYEQYVNNSRIKVIPQGFDLNTSYSVEIPFNIKNIKKPSFAYAGEFYEKIRNPEKILSFLSTLDLDFTFVIFTSTQGKIYEEILKKYEKMMDGKLIICNKVPRRDLIKYLEQFDFLLNINNLSENRKPSKLVDFAMSNKPILSIQPDQFDKKVLLEFLSGNYKKQEKINLEMYDIKNIVLKFEKLFLESLD